MADAEEEPLGILQEIWPWQVRLAWPVGATRGGPRWIEIRPSPNATEEDLIGGLSSTVLREVDFKDAARQWRELLAARSDEDEANIRALQAAVRKKSDTLRRLAAEGVTKDRYLAYLSYVYLGVINAGIEPVIENLAELAGKTSSTIKGHLWQARKKGLLTSTPGLLGGDLTERGNAIIDEVTNG